MTTLYPHGYSRSLLSIDGLFARHHVDKMHPEYARRLRAWLEAQEGQIGIGGSWRETGSQPSKPGFAPEGKSFHQYQRFASGRVAFCAVDLVARNGTNIHRAPRWDEVPAQGTPAAARWGVHCNVSTEAWHMQPVEIDGWDSWDRNGRPEPVLGYPLPTDPPPAPTPVPPAPAPEPPEEPDMVRFCKTNPTDTALLVRYGMMVEHVRNPADLTRWVDSGMMANDLTTIDDIKPLLPLLTYVGPDPFYPADDPTPTKLRTRSEMFRRQIA